ncbi:MAG: hypothetical protein JXR40_12970 [Pontiellaceae bacterium]|nr:hypothetical protein [Pontiellaceae bacterium]
MSTKAEKCPNCGATCKKKKIGCLSAIGITFLVLIIVGIIGSLREGSSGDINASSSSSASKIEVIDFGWGTGDFGSRILVGTARNNTARQYSYVQIEINLYDSNGTQVGSTLANINNLEPNGSWRFEAPVFESDAVDAKIKDITSF